MSEKENYRKIAKNTAVLGGAQVIQMLVTLIRTKVVALLLGPLGIGINTLILSAISTIQQFSSFGIYQSGVRDLSEANSDDDRTRIAKLRLVFNRLTLICGLIGVVVCIALSPFLSAYSFGDYSYTWSFVAVAITLLFMALQSGKSTIMQATQNLRLIAKATIYGAVFNLLLTVPMFYFWGVKGIVPAIVVGYAIFWLVNRHFERKIVFATVAAPTKAETIEQSKPILKLGWVLMVSNLLMVTFTFLLNGFISNFGSVDDVGLFQAASAICLQSLVIINTTLSSDYFPRLAAVHSDDVKVKDSINSQTEIMLYLIGIISVLLIVFAPLVVKLLLSSEFLVVVPLLRVMSLAFIFRTIWVILGMVVLAKGNKKLYFIFDAVIGHGALFLVNIGAYYFWGLEGLGYSYLAGSILMVVLLSVLLFVKYRISLNKSAFLLFVILCILLTFAYTSTLLFSGWVEYISLGLLTIGISAFCLYKLNTKLGLKQMIISKIRR